MKTFAQPSSNLCRALFSTSLVPQLLSSEGSGCSAGSQRVLSGYTTGAPDRYFCLGRGGLIRYEDFGPGTLEPPASPHLGVARPTAARGILSSACGQRAHGVRTACGRDRPFSPPPRGYAVHEDSFSSTPRFAPSGYGRSAGAQGLCHWGLEWDFVDMRTASWPQTGSRPSRPAPPRELRRCSEGGRKAVGRRKRSTEGGRKVLWSASWPSRTQRTRRELLQSDLGRPPEGGWKALERYRRRSEGGRPRPFDHLIWG